MNIAAIGTGIVGQTLATARAAKGHEIVFGTREPVADRISAIVKACGTSASATLVERCHAGADAVLLAVPVGNAVEIASNTGDLSGKVLTDANNPIGDDMMPFTEAGESLAELIAKATGARVVKAFNTIGMGNVAELTFGSQRAAGFVCGDDADAKSLTLGLASEIGFDAVDCGPLAAARWLEPKALMWIRLAYVENNGPDIAFGLLRRGEHTLPKLALLLPPH